MRFGQTEEEAAADTRGTSGGAFIRYMKDGDTTFRILQESKDWTYYWEHFNPGASFPCTNDTETCPGCTSNNEKMAKPSRKVAFNVLEGDYVNVYGVPPLLADKLKLRENRLGTITDRDYMITRYKTGQGDRKKTEYDVESLGEKPIDLSKYDLHNIEDMLAQAYNDAWGDSNKAKVTQAKAQENESEGKLINLMKNEAKVDLPQDPPSEPEAQSVEAEGEEVSESWLRSQNKPALLKFLEKQKIEVPADETKSTDTIVDWLIAQP